MKRSAFLLPIALFSLGGCISMAPSPKIPYAALDLPETYPLGDSSGTYHPENWWSQFQDPVLDGLVDDALAQNLDIEMAMARLQRARAQARLSGSALFPTIEATGSASYSDTPLSGSALGSLPGVPTRLENETYSVGAGASYELDLFGSNNDDLRAARADARATAHDYRAMRLAVAAETISAYFEIVDARHQIELALLTTDVLNERAVRTEDRYQRGLVSSFELYQVRQDYRSVEASLPVRENALSAAESRLAALLAQYPDQVESVLSVPLTPRLVFDPVPSGLPSELLIQRPDVASAWDRLEAARLRIGARRADRFPSLRLNGSTGAQGSTPSAAVDFGQNWLVSLGANLVAPIIDGGRITANIKVARATYDELSASYGQAVLNAYREVDLAIASYEEQRQRYRLIAAQRSDARATLDLQAQRYQAGVVDYVGYLDALRSFYQVESSLSAAGRDVALARLAVHRALGGDWEVTDPANKQQGTMQ